MNARNSSNPSAFAVGALSGDQVVSSADDRAVTKALMIEPRLSVMRLAKALVGAASVRDTAAASAMTRLHASLSKLIGQGGFDVLLRRSLELARREHPLLVGVATSPSGELTGLNDPSRDPEAIEQAEVAIVAHFIELMVVLIGEELAMRLVDEVRQEAQSGARARAKEAKE